VKVDLDLEEVLPHTEAAVWAALTDPAALAEWLMPNDFEARVGARFTMRGHALPGFRGWVDAEVLELDPPRRMVRSWSADDWAQPTIVTFALSPVDGGTKLCLTHRGDADPLLVSCLEEGWPARFGALAALLQTSAHHG
jgi:uncharacterized protein YndB with AHSA1/START domain